MKASNTSNVDKEFAALVKRGNATKTKDYIDLNKDNINESYVDAKGNSLLMYALKSGDIKTAKVLIENNIGIDEAVVKYMSGKEKYVELNELINAKGYIREVSPLLDAVEQENIEKVKGCIESGADLNAVDKDGNTPLMVAVMSGNDKIALALIKAGADLIVRPINSSELSDKEVQQMQAQIEVDINRIIVQDKERENQSKIRQEITEIQRKQAMQDNDVLLVEVAKGAEALESLEFFFKDFKDQIDKLKGQEERLQMLQDKPNRRPEEEKQLQSLIKGSKDRKERIDSMAKERDEVVNFCYRSGHTALTNAVMEGRQEIVDLLVREGADIHKRSGPYNMNALEYAAQSDNHKAMDVLVNAGSRIDTSKVEFPNKDKMQMVADSLEDSIVIAAQTRVNTKDARHNAKAHMQESVTNRSTSPDSVIAQATPRASILRR